MVTSVLSTSVTASLKKKNIFSESNKQLIIEYITVTLQMYETMDSDLTRPGGLYCQNLTTFVYNNTVRENKNYNCSATEYDLGPWITKLSKLEDARLVREALNKSLCHSFPLLPSLRKLNLELNLEESDILWIVKLQQIKTLDLRGSTFNNYNKTTSGFNFTFILESLPELSTFHFDLMNNPQYGFSASDITQLRNAFPNKLLCLKSNSRECDDGLAYQKGQ